MKIVLFVEGKTERDVLPAFFKRWLDDQLETSVAVDAIQFGGAGNYINQIRDKAGLYLEGRLSPKVLGAIGLLDFYGCPNLPDPSLPLKERYQKAKAQLEEEVGHKRFRQHFAVHETEAWLLSEPSVLPKQVRELLPSKAVQPEQVNFNEPPAKLLDRLYEKSLNRRYRKPVDGESLFRQLSPATAREKCPYLRLLLDDLLELAQRRRKS